MTQNKPRPQVTAETDRGVMKRVRVAELEDEPGGEAVMVRVYVPGGTVMVVEIVKEEVVPVAVGSMLVGEKLKMPQGLGPEPS